MVPESAVIAGILLQGPDDDEWREKIEHQNVLRKRSIGTAKRQAGLIRQRLEPFENELLEIVASGSAHEARQVLFAAALAHSALLADFMVVIREHFRVLAPSIRRQEWLDYVERCADIDPQMSEWKHSTIDKLGDMAFRMLHEVGYLEEVGRNVLRPVFLHTSVKSALIDAGRHRELDLMRTNR